VVIREPEEFDQPIQTRSRAPLTFNKERRAMKTIIELVKNNTAKFVYFRDGSMVYDILDEQNRKVATFPVDVSNKDEIGNAAFEATHKAITLMRYIRKAVKDETIFIF
jgi:hypothetical protein